MIAVTRPGSLCLAVFLLGVAALRFMHGEDVSAGEHAFMVFLFGVFAVLDSLGVENES